MGLSRAFTRRALRVAVAVLLFACAFAGSAAAQVPQSVLAPAGPVARIQRDLIVTAISILIPIFIVVGGGLLYTVIRFRGRPGDGLPPQTHGSVRLEVIWTVIPILLLIIIAVPTVKQIFALNDVPADAIDIRATGYQWWWSFEYPEHGFATANELRIPVGKPVRLTLTSSDVIHSFWVPRLAGKMDVIPGRENVMWFQADEPGVYYGQCAEYCGTSHANMRFRVVALPQEEYDAWLQGRVAVAAVAPADALAQRGHDLFVNGTCAACHTIDGTSAQGKVGPDLTDFGSRTSLAAGLLENTPENLRAWLKNPQSVKPGARMPNLGLSDADVNALAAFLMTLE